MIDTIAYKSWLLLKAIPPRHPHRLCPRGWKCKYAEANDEEAHCGYDFWLEDHRLGIRLFGRYGPGDAKIIEKVECELPAVLNGRLLKTQADLDTAFAYLKAELQEICDPFTPLAGHFPGDRPGDPHTVFTRIDLVWQFDIEPALILQAHANAKHPQINKQSLIARDQTVALPGTKLYVRIYDKKRKMRAPITHHAMRVEVQLERDKISEIFALNGQALKRLNIDSCYGAYRRVLLDFRFDPVPCICRRGSLNDFLAWAVTVLPDHDPVGMYCHVKRLSPRKAREKRRDVGNQVPALLGFSWRDLLPASGLPPVVDVPCAKKERQLAGLRRPSIARDTIRAAA